MNKKITIEKLDSGWLLTIEQEDMSKVLEAHDSGGTLMLSVTANLAGSASRIELDKPKLITIQCPVFS